MTEVVHRKVTRVDFAETPAAAGAPPTTPITVPLTNAAFACVDKKCLLVGGYSPNECAAISQVIEYDMATRQWTSLGQFPGGPLTEATMVSVGASYYLFGGYNDKNTVDAMWTLATENNESKGCVWKEVSVASETKPSARRGHSMVVSNAAEPEEAVIYVFGGFDGNQRLNDLWEFKVATGSWRNIDYTSAIAPPPRDNTALAVDAANNRLVLFGGYTTCRVADLYTFDLQEEKWTKYPPLTGPTPRQGMFAAISGNYFVIGLGIDSKGPSPLTCQLNLVDMKWNVPGFEGDELEGRSHSSYCVIDGGKRVFAFGGTNDKKYSASLYEIELEKTEAIANPKGKK